MHLIFVQGTAVSQIYADIWSEATRPQNLQDYMQVNPGDSILYGFQISKDVFPEVSIWFNMSMPQRSDS